MLQEFWVYCQPVDLYACLAGRLRSNVSVAMLMLNSTTCCVSTATLHEISGQPHGTLLCTCPCCWCAACVPEPDAVLPSGGGSHTGKCAWSCGLLAVGVGAGRPQQHATLSGGRTVPQNRSIGESVTWLPSVCNGPALGIGPWPVHFMHMPHHRCTGCRSISRYPAHCCTCPQHHRAL